MRRPVSWESLTPKKNRAARFENEERKRKDLKLPSFQDMWHERMTRQEREVFGLTRRQDRRCLGTAEWERFRTGDGIRRFARI